MTEGLPRPTPRPERALADILGLASRARGLVHGTDMTRKAVRDGEVQAVILAADASATQAQKLVPLLQARKIPFHVCLSREALGFAIGRGPVSAVGITNDSFAKRASVLAAALSSPQG